MRTAGELGLSGHQKLIEPGIYFGMPDHIYHADPALGSTSIKELVIDPIEYQYERLHGAEKKETFALKWGQAIHVRALEGAAELERRFPIEPEKAAFPGLLDSYDDLKKHCGQLGLKPGKNKNDAISAIRDFDKEVPIWDEIWGDFQRRLAAEGKTSLPISALDHIEQAVAWMQRDKLLAPVMENGTLTAGASEVSIFYVDNGVRLKARIDHLLSHAVVDLKSFRPIFAERVLNAAKRAIARMRYDLQGAAYLRALRHAVDLHKKGLVFNNPYGPEFLQAVFDSVSSNQLKWIWVLIKATGAPQPVVAEFDMTSNIFKQALVDVDDAVIDFKKYVDQYGLDTDWMPNTSAQLWGDGDFPPFAFQ